MTIPMWAKKAVRPLVPDRVMARFRLAQHSRQVRVNVDIVVDDPRRAGRRLASTPDTYRVRRRAGFGAAPPATVVTVPGPVPAGPREVVVLAEPAATAAEVQWAAVPLSDASYAAAITGVLSPARMVGRARTEPTVAPCVIALRREVLDEVEIPEGMSPLPALRDRLRDAGHRLAVVEGSDHGLSWRRGDPIEGPGAVVLGAVPMHDVGGGSRGTQIALELLRGGFHVTYVALFGTVESVDLGIRFIHPRLEQVRASEFDTVRYLQRFGGTEPLVVLEVPAAAYVSPTADLQAYGFRLVYDLIDDWSAPSLGGDWYRHDVEAGFVASADALTGSAPDLVARLEASGREAQLVPNAVNPSVFGADPGPQPADVPSGRGPLLGYHGSLYGDWFDWEALAAVANGVPGARIVVIGDASRPRPEMPGNVRFLGLRAQGDLPAYLGALDAGLVPFVVSDVTHAVSPLKTFEYLAMGVPVAAPPLRSLAGIDGVYTAPLLLDAVAAALDAPRPDRAAALAAHSWEARLVDLCRTAGVAFRPGSGTEAVVVRRPVIHYARDQRRL